MGRRERGEAAVRPHHHGDQRPPDRWTHWLSESMVSPTTAGHHAPAETSITVQRSIIGSQRKNETIPPPAAGAAKTFLSHRKRPRYGIPTMTPCPMTPPLAWRGTTPARTTTGPLLSFRRGSAHRCSNSTESSLQGSWSGSWWRG